MLPERMAPDLLHSRERFFWRQEYLQAILFRDLIEHHDMAHPRAVTDLAHWLIDNTVSSYSVNRLAGYLKSLGHKVQRVGLPRVVRGQRLPVHGAGVRRVVGAQPCQPQEDLLRRSRAEEAGTIDAVPAWQFLLDLPESAGEALPGGA